MGKNKLKKFADMKTLPNVLEYPWAVLQQEGFPYKGLWARDFFGNDNPITVELGCGKGEYTVELARNNPDRNYIGIDIKGARMWKGARRAHDDGLKNVAFLRTDIEMLESFFGTDELDELWITFPDPQMQKTRKRLVASRFLNLYRHLLRKGGIVNFKTDSPFLYQFTSRLIDLNGLETLMRTDDLYGSGLADPVTSIKTFYEQQWLTRGKQIKMLSFRLADSDMADPNEDDIERDDYHSWRGRPAEGNCQ